MKGKIFFCSQLLLIFIWSTLMINTDSYYSVYLLMTIVGTICIYNNYKKPKSTSPLDYLFALFFALCITASNYQIFTNYTSPESLNIFFSFSLAALSFVGSFFLSLNILLSAKTLKFKNKLKSPTKKQQIIFFTCCFLAFTLINLLILLLCYYPGVLTSDSTDQINQMITNTYSNHHPFYFTVLVKLFVSIGLHLSGNINVGIALFSIFQILVLAASFSFALLTLYQIKVSKKILIPTLIFLILMPYNIMYSFTMWKDVLFGAFFLVFVVSLYRYFKQIGNHYSLMLHLIILSGIIICLFRNNALIAFVASVFFFFVIFKKQYIKLGLCLIGIVLISFILKKPVLKTLEVRQPDILESLSIPMQQIARVITDSKDNLSIDEQTTISNIVDINKIPSAYNPIIHDPIKRLVRIEGSKEYLSSHPFDFISLYLSLGFRYPSLYLKAWIDQTKGYWNGGYSYWKWADEVSENNSGVYRATISPRLQKTVTSYLSIFEKLKFLNPFISIGLVVWILIVAFYKNIFSKNRHLLFICLTILMTWGTLLIATPVFSEFRYIYFAFTTAPFILITSFTNQPTRKAKNKK